MPPPAHARLARVLLYLQRGLDLAAVQPAQPKHVRLRRFAREVHDADDFVRGIGLDKQPARRVEGGRRVAGHPVAVGRQEIDGQVLGKDHVVKCGLIDVKEGALRDLLDDPRPGVPMRGVVMQRKNPAIDHGVAAEAVSHAPAERLAIAFPAERPAKDFGPLVVALISAIDLRVIASLSRPAAARYSSTARQSWIHASASIHRYVS